MAWQARVEAIDKFMGDPTYVTAHVAYYDDTILVSGQPVVQFTQDFKFRIDMTAAEMQQEIVATGKLARTAFNRVTTLRTAAPAGTIIAIP